MQPFAECVVQVAGIRGELLQVVKILPLYLPGEGIMLEETQPAALHDAEGLLMLKEHTDHSGLRKRLVDAAAQGMKAGLLKDCCGKAGTVMGVDAFHAAPKCGAALCSRIDGEIAAL